MTAPAWLDAHGVALWSRVEAVIASGPDAALDPAIRDALALELLAWQRGRCQPLDRALRAMGAADEVRSVSELPGIPTEAFKTARIASFDAASETRVFHTSGTSGEARGRHAFGSTALYDAAAIACGARWLLPRGPYRFVLLAERERDAPHSSLSYMLARFAEHFA
ncbi:MAG: hypothetical protein WCJ30_14700, partial [Deltaproteobacteria bacterium]